MGQNSSRATIQVILWAKCYDTAPRSLTFKDSMSFLNSSSYMADITDGQTFSWWQRRSIIRKKEKARVEPKPFNNSLSYLPPPLDDFIVDVSDHHPVDDSDSKKPGEDPLQDVKPDVRAARRQNDTLGFFQDTKRNTKTLNKKHIRLNS